MTSTILSEEKLNTYFIVHGLNVGDDVLSRAKLGGGFSLAKIADICYEKKDYIRAFDWYRLDAANNMSYAQLRVGYMYHHGEGVSADYKLAMEWCTKARDNGNPAAANYIREIHGGGLSVTESSEQDYQPGQENKKRLNDKGYYIYDIQKKFDQIENDMKGQNEKNGLLESKLELSEERLRVVEYENKILKQEIEALKLTMTIDKTQPLEMNLNKDGAYQRKETVTKKPKTKTLDSIIKNGTQGDDPENDLYYD